MQKESTEPCKLTRQMQATLQNKAPSPGVLASPQDSASPAPTSTVDMDALKLEILALLRLDIMAIFKTELQAALGDDLTTIRANLQSVKTQLENN